MAKSCPTYDGDTHSNRSTYFNGSKQNMGILRYLVGGGSQFMVAQSDGSRELVSNYFVLEGNGIVGNTLP